MYKTIIMTVLVGALLTGCGYTNSALQYAEVQNKRVQSGYDAKKEMTNSIMKYVAEMNKDCGVKVEMVNGVPVTNVKQCITVHEAMASVGQVQIQRAEGIESIGTGVAKAATDIATLAVPLGTVYMQTDAQKHSADTQVRITESNNAATIATTQSNNDMMGGMMDSYTGNFQNVTNTTTTDTIDTSTVNPTDYTDGTVSISNP